MTYVKETFDAQSFTHAKDIVLTPDPANPNKFTEETQFLANFIQRQVALNENSRVLDFGCGMGRVAREIIAAFNCQVVGVDISARMLVFANNYIQNPLFTPLLAEAGWAKNAGMFDAAIAAFVLQHTEDPFKEVAALASVLTPGGILILLDDGKRFVPTDVDTQGFVVWSNDGVVVEDIVKKYFTLVGHYPYMKRDEKVLSLWRKI